MTDACLNSDAALDLQGRTAKAHLDKWQFYGEKSVQHATSAALILIQVKESLEHGQWLPWLKQHDIPARTAQQLMQEHKRPEKAEERRSYQRTQKQQARTNTQDDCVFHHQPQRSEHHGKEYTVRAHSDPSAVAQQRARLLGYVRDASADEIQRLCAFLSFR